MNKTQNRRDFLGKIGMSGAVAIAVGAVGTEPLFGQDKSKTNTEAIVQNSNPSTVRHLPSLMEAKLQFEKNRNGQSSQQQFGLSGDIPVGGANVQ